SKIYAVIILSRRSSDDTRSASTVGYSAALAEDQAASQSASGRVASRGETTTVPATASQAAPHEAAQAAASTMAQAVYQAAPIEADRAATPAADRVATLAAPTEASQTAPLTA